MWGLLATETSYILPRPIEAIVFVYHDETELEAIKDSPAYTDTSMVLLKFLMNMPGSDVGGELATQIGAKLIKGG
eukprot:CAMPEP_0201282160 /NCGR_PEP_ID=MMETSP1317-20130820/4961_1 /ASSEMBLY_ACC=CAM_ASM_000770 /TAXON_ID=187299 /ORGANISM="Undescribed Undescribed, Strain Undescribed" /LENGTH=74 /DNA_ID=CAMNT_0047594089 /DNA_START=1 /DNA_END=221 /DNA_ORIENTATION=-